MEENLTNLRFTDDVALFNYPPPPKKQTNKQKQQQQKSKTTTATNKQTKQMEKHLTVSTQKS